MWLDQTNGLITTINPILKCYFTEEFNSIHHSRHRPPSGGQNVSSQTGNSLSSPEMIKTLSRTLTPPVSPFHHQLRSSTAPNGERKSPSAVHPQPGMDFLGSNYSGDLNTNHFNTKNIWIRNFLKFGFQMVWYSNGQSWVMSYLLDQPFKYQTST